MRSKLALALFLTMIMTAVLLGCGEEQVPKIKDVSDLGGKVIAMLSTPLATKDMDSFISKYIGFSPRDINYFNRYSDAITATLTGKADAVYVPKFISEYYVKRNNKLASVKSRRHDEQNIIMVVRSEDQKLKDNLDSAIDTLQKDGTMQRLEKEWITNLPANKELVAGEVSKIPGAKTIYVGVCGDMVPLDYIAVDGRPAGFNVALLTETGKILYTNFEFVSLDFQARFTALKSKKIDLVFYHDDIKTFAANQELKDGSWLGTKPYYTTETGYFLVKK